MNASVDYVALEQEVKGSEPKLHISNEECSRFSTLSTSTSIICSAAQNAEIILEGDGIVATYSPTLPPALKGVSFALHAGQIVGVCGRTGCGKSTLTMVLARAMSVSEGVIKLRGKHINNMFLREYRNQVQIYPQDSYIFSGSLREFLDPHGIHSDLKLNGLLGELTRARTTHAFKENNVDTTPSNRILSSKEDEVMLSLDFAIASSGGNLSAGQKQVIALTRAALAQAYVVSVLDEITSNMDSLASSKSIEILKRELTSKGVAVLMVSHRVCDLGLCDSLWLMSHGTILESGNPQSVLQNLIE